MTHVDPSAGDGALRQRADCTIKALAAAAAIPYEQAHAIAEEAGRRRGRVFKSSVLIEAAKDAGFNFRKIRGTGMTINRFTKKYPQGRFYARKKGHAFAIVDGVVSDKTTLGSRIVDVWQLVSVRNV